MSFRNITKRRGYLKETGVGIVGKRISVKIVDKIIETKTK